MGSLHRMLPLVCAALFTACEEAAPPSSLGTSGPVLPATESSQEFGDFTVHFNALSTDQLTADIASQYGIVRSQNRAMLNVSILRRSEDGPGTAVAADVDVSVSNLSGQVKNITMRPIVEGDAIYYIGEVAVTNAETLIFSLDLTPEGETESQSIRFMKQFFVD